MPIDPDEFEFTAEELDELIATTDERSPEEMAQVEARLRIFAQQLKDAGAENAAAEADEIIRQAAFLKVTLQDRVEVLDELQSKHSTVPSSFE